MAAIASARVGGEGLEQSSPLSEAINNPDVVEASRRFGKLARAGRQYRDEWATPPAYLPAPGDMLPPIF